MGSMKTRNQKKNDSSWVFRWYMFGFDGVWVSGILVALGIVGL
jgi:hypothetical protein